MSRRVDRFDKLKVKKLRHGRGGRLVADVVVWADERRFSVVADCGNVICRDADKCVSCDGLDLNAVPSVIGIRTDRKGYEICDWWLGEGDMLVPDNAADGGFRRVPANFASEIAVGGGRKPVKVSQGRRVNEALRSFQADGASWF